MPVILDNGSEELKTWLDPGQSTWSKELQSLLKPFKGELEVYPVSQEVGKVGNNSSSFIIPVASSENKSNIANFFAKGAAKGHPKTTSLTEALEPLGKEVKKESEMIQIKHESEENRETVDHNGTEDNAPLPVPKNSCRGIKREIEDVPDMEPPNKISKTYDSPSKAMATANPAAKTKSATSNAKPSPKKAMAKDNGSQKITSFFGK